MFSRRDRAPLRPIDEDARSNYRNYMKPIELKVTRIGNSRGVRLPAMTLERFGIGERVIMEERSDGILLRPIGPATPKLSWEDTAREMAASEESWAEWDATLADGLDTVLWDAGQPRRVAERKGEYKPPRRRRK